MELTSKKQISNFVHYEAEKKQKLVTMKLSDLRKYFEANSAIPGMSLKLNTCVSINFTDELDIPYVINQILWCQMPMSL